MVKAFRVENKKLPEALKAFNADYDSGMIRCTVDKVLPEDKESIVLVNMTRGYPYIEALWERGVY